MRSRAGISNKRQIAVAGEDVAAIEANGAAGEPVVLQQPNHARHEQAEVDRVDPVAMRRLEFFAQLADFSPRLEVVIGVLAFLDVDHLGQFADQETKGPAYIDDVNRHVLAVKHQHARCESAARSDARHVDRSWERGRAARAEPLSVDSDFLSILSPRAAENQFVGRATQSPLARFHGRVRALRRIDQEEDLVKFPHREKGRREDRSGSRRGGWRRVASSRRQARLRIGARGH